MSKKIITEMSKLPKEVVLAIKEKYPFGFEDKLTKFTSPFDGVDYSALIFDFEDTSYLIKVRKRVVSEAVEEDDDYYDNDEDGVGVEGDDEVMDDI